MLYDKAARYTDLQNAIEETFEGLKLEMIACELCGDYHPPELHLTRPTLFDDEEPAEA